MTCHTLFKLSLTAVFAAGALGGIQGCTRQGAGNEERGPDGKAGSSQEDRQEEWTSVAVIGGGDEITQMHIRALLKSQGIDCMTEGSTVYGVLVPKSEAARATRLVREDAQQRRYWISFSKDDKISPRESDWKQEKLDKPYAAVLGMTSYQPNSDLGSLLRRDEVAKQAAAFPIVYGIRFLRREFLQLPKDGEGNPAIGVKAPLPQVGYEVELEFHAQAADDTSGSRMSFQVWGGGEGVRRGGSNTWGPSSHAK